MLIDNRLPDSKGHLVAALGLDGSMCLENNVFPFMPVHMPHRDWSVRFDRELQALIAGGLPAGVYRPGAAIFSVTMLEAEMEGLCL